MYVNERMPDGIYLDITCREETEGRVKSGKRKMRVIKQYPHLVFGYCCHEATENQLTLEALVRAVERIQRPAQIRVFTRCAYVFNAIQNGWAQQWKEAGWKNAKGMPIKNMNLWERLLSGKQPHIFTATEEAHSYREWMFYELEKRMEKQNVCQ